MNQLDELNSMKSQVNLAAYAGVFGYEVDSRESKGASYVLRRKSDNEKLLVKRGNRGYDIYVSCRDDRKGSVIDFVQHEIGTKNLGEVRKVLRDWLRMPTPNLSLSIKSDSIQSTDEPDRKKVNAVWGAATWLPEPGYLLQRGIDLETLHDERFHDTWRITTNGVLLFLHRDHEGGTGYEIRGDNIKSFTKDGKRAFWHTTNLGYAGTVIVTESAINALSHAVLYGWGDVAYISLAGNISTRQRTLIKSLFATGIDVLSGVDNDTSGDKYHEIIEDLAGRKVPRYRPIGNDWNADLMY